jgi:hypothetical protein
MNEEFEKQEELLSTTDCLEAIGAFKAMKNFLFVIMIICILLLQVSFWLMNLGYVKTVECSDGPEVSAVYKTSSGSLIGLAAEIDVISQQDSNQQQIATAARQVTKDLPGQIEVEQQEQVPPTPPVKSEVPESPASEAPAKAARSFKIGFSYLAWLIRFCNFILIVVALLYCLILIFSLKISLTGRLGGINHISRAFFLSLFMLIFLLPWQRLFNGVIAGAIFTPCELLEAFNGKAQRDNIILQTLYYFRFVVLWLVVLVFAVFAQIRTIRWAKASLRRLEII